MIWHERRCTFPNFGRPACLFVTGLVMAVSSVTTFSETWGQAWAPQANPTSLMFQAAQGGPNPSSQAINLSKGTTDQRIWSSNENIAWLSASPAWGTMTTSAQVVVSVNSSGLAAGTYSGNVVFALSVGGTVSVPITLRVSPVSSGGTSSTGTTPPPPPPPPPSTTGTTTTATLAWNSNSESDLAGYKVYVGTSSGRYGSPIDVGKVTSYTMANLNVGNTYYFVVTAYDTSGNESLHSAEVSKSIY